MPYDNAVSITRENNLPLLETRRAPGPHASQPQIGLVMVRISACIETACHFLASVCAPGDVPAPAAFADAVGELLASTERLDEREVTISVLCEAVAKEVERSLVTAEAQFSSLTQAPRRRGDSRLDSWVLRALLRAGFDVDLADLDTLDLLSDPTAQLAARTLALGTALAQSRNGYLAQELARVYDAITVAPSVQEALEVVAAAEIDAERLCWAAVSRESRRHILLVLKEANRAARSWPDRQADSFIGYAYQGLRLALRNYDPSRGMFSTYACPRIRGTIRDGVRSEHHLPKRLTTFIRKVEGAREKLRHDLGRHPTLQEVASALDMDLEKLSPISRYGAPVSYDELVARPGASEPSALIAFDDDPINQALLDARNEAVHEALSQLDPDDAQAVRLLVLDPVSVADAQAVTGVSARQLRLRRDRGLARLAELLADWAPSAA